MKIIFYSLIILCLLCCSRRPVARTAYFPKVAETVPAPPDKNNVWVYVMAGQSNMAGRGQVEPSDTVPAKRILTINERGQLVLAKEPLHFYEPSLTGLDCGYSFGKTMIRNIPDTIFVLLIPTAVGGSSISQWLGDSVYRNVKLFSNFREKVAIGKQYGTIKAVLWHQGESDANSGNIPLYKNRLVELVRRFRSVIDNPQLPVLFGELGSYSKNKEAWASINTAIHAAAAGDKNTAVITTSDLEHKGDSIHFNSKGQRVMGQRFAQAYLDKFYKAKPQL